MASRLQSLDILTADMVKHLFSSAREKAIQLRWCDVPLAGRHTARNLLVRELSAKTSRWEVTVVSKAFTLP